jgi:hypothetical protein
MEENVPDFFVSFPSLHSIGWISLLHDLLTMDWRNIQERRSMALKFQTDQSMQLPFVVVRVMSS